MKVVGVFGRIARMGKNLTTQAPGTNSLSPCTVTISYVYLNEYAHS